MGGWRTRCVAEALDVTRVTHCQPVPGLAEGSAPACARYILLHAVVILAGNRAVAVSSAIAPRCKGW